MASQIRKRYCCVTDCPNKNGKEDKTISMCKISSQEPLRNDWMRALQSHAANLSDSTQYLVCELHLETNHINRRKDRNILSKDARTTIFEYSNR